MDPNNLTNKLQIWPSSVDLQEHFADAGVFLEEDNTEAKRLARILKTLEYSAGSATERGTQFRTIRKGIKRRNLTDPEDLRNAVKFVFQKRQRSRTYERWNTLVAQMQTHRTLRCQLPIPIAGLEVTADEVMALHNIGWDLPDDDFEKQLHTRVQQIRTLKHFAGEEILTDVRALRIIKNQQLSEDEAQQLRDVRWEKVSPLHLACIVGALNPLISLYHDGWDVHDPLALTLAQSGEITYSVFHQLCVWGAQPNEDLLQTCMEKEDVSRVQLILTHLQDRTNLFEFAKYTIFSNMPRMLEVLVKYLQPAELHQLARQAAYLDRLEMIKILLLAGAENIPPPPLMKYKNSLFADMQARQIGTPQFYQMFPDALAMSRYELDAVRFAHAFKIGGTIALTETFSSSLEGLADSSQALRWMAEGTANENLRGVLERAATWNPLHGPAMLKTFQENQSLLIDAGWVSHAIGIILSGNYLLICNRGAKFKSSIKIYEIDRSKVTAQHLSNLATNHRDGNAFEQTWNGFLRDTSAKQSEKCAWFEDQKQFRAQHVGNCSWESHETAVYALFLLESSDTALLSFYSWCLQQHYAALTSMLRHNTLIVGRGLERMVPLWEQMEKTFPDKINLNPFRNLLRNIGIQTPAWNRLMNPQQFENAILQQPNAPLNNSYTPLTYYIQCQDMRMVKALIDNGASLDLADKRGVTPLGQALEVSHEEMVELLLTRGADPNVESSGCRPLTMAIIRGKKRLLGLLLKHSGEALILWMKSTRDERTALDHCLERADGEALTMLVEAGLDLTYGTPAVRALDFSLNKDGTVNIEEFKKRIDLLHAHGVSLDQMAQYEGYQANLLWFVGKRESWEAMKYLLEKGANASAVCYKDAKLTNYPMAHVFSFPFNHSKQIEICQLLLKHGANPNIVCTVRPKGRVRTTIPLLIAIKKNHFELCALLINYGADLNRDSIAQQLIKYLNYKILLAALEKGINPKLKAKKEKHPGTLFIHHLIGTGPVDRGGDVRAPIRTWVRNAIESDRTLLNPIEGWSLIHFVVLNNGKKADINMLKKLGANINARNRDGDTPLLLAARLPRISQMTHLIESGADCNAENSRGETPALALISRVFRTDNCKLSPSSLEKHLKNLKAHGANISKEQLIQYAKDLATKLNETKIGLEKATKLLKATVEIIRRI